MLWKAVCFPCAAKVKPFAHLTTVRAAIDEKCAPWICALDQSQKTASSKLTASPKAFSPFFPVLTVALFSLFHPFELRQHCIMLNERRSQKRFKHYHRSDEPKLVSVTGECRVHLQRPCDVPSWSSCGATELTKRQMTYNVHGTLGSSTR